MIDTRNGFAARKFYIQNKDIAYVANSDFYIAEKVLEAVQMETSSAYVIKTFK